MSSSSKFELFGSAMGKKAAQLLAPAEPDAPDEPSEPKPDPFGLVTDGKANKKLLADPTAPGVTTKKDSLPPSAFNMPDNNFYRQTDLDLINPGTGRINSIDNAYTRKAMHVPNYSVKPIYNANSNQLNYFSTPAGRQLLPNSNLESSFFSPLIKDMDNRIKKELDDIEPLARAKEYHTKNTDNPLISSKYMESVKNNYEQQATRNSNQLFPWIRPGENSAEVLSRPGVVEEQRDSFDHLLSDPVRRGTMNSRWLPDKDKFEGTESVLGQYPSQMSVANLHPVTLGSLDSINGAQDPRTRNLSPPFLTQLNPSPAYATNGLDPMTGRFNFSPKGLDPEKQRAIERANLAGQFSERSRLGKPIIKYHNFLGPEFNYNSRAPEESSRFSDDGGARDYAVSPYIYNNLEGIDVKGDIVDAAIRNREMNKKYRDAGIAYTYDPSDKLIRGDKGFQLVSDKENEVDPKGSFSSDYGKRYVDMLLNRKLSEKGETRTSPLNNFYDNVIRGITGAEDRPSVPFVPDATLAPETLAPKPLATVSRASMLSDLKEPPEVLPPTKNPNSIEEAIKRNPDNLNTFFNSLSNSAFGSMSNRRTPTYVGPPLNGFDRTRNNQAIGDNTNRSSTQGTDEEFLGRSNSRLNKIKTDVNGKVLPSIMKAETGLISQTFSQANEDFSEESPDPRQVDPKFSDLYTPANKNIAAANKLIRGDAGFQLLGSAQNEGERYSPNGRSAREDNSATNAELYSKPQAFLSNLAQILATSHALHEVPGVKPVKLDLLSNLNSQQIADIVKQDNLFGVGKKDILSWLSSNSPNATAFINSLQQEHQPTWKEEATLYPPEEEKVKNPLEAPMQQKIMPSRRQLLKSIEG